MTSPEGLLLLDKPAGPTSHDLVASVRRALAVRRVGHTGTLDPMATGLLALVLGRATRLARFVPSSPKRYVGEIRLGVATDTDDVCGSVVSRHTGPLPDHDAVRQAAAALTGNLLQRPPHVSARSVGGTRLYRLARRGVPVEAPPKAVAVTRFDLEPLEDGLWAFDAEVSAGTYIRSLARDLGEALRCGGTLAHLRRVAIGPFRVEQALSIPRDPSPETIRRAILPLASMPLSCESLVLPEAEAERFVRGIPVPCAGDHPTDEKEFAARDTRGAVLGVGVARSARLHPIVVLAPAAPDAGLPGGNGVW